MRFLPSQKQRRIIKSKSTLSHLFSFSRDRFRTVVNVLGDAIGAGIVEHLSRDELEAADKSKMEEGEGQVEGDAIELVDKPATEGRYTPKDPDHIVSNP